MENEKTNRFVAFKKSAESGNAIGQHNLGVSYIREEMVWKRIMKRP